MLFKPRKGSWINAKCDAFVEDDGAKDVCEREALANGEVTTKP